MTYKFYLKISVSNNVKNPKKIDLMDILGKEFQEYYDGFGFDSKEKDFFFYDIPLNLIELVPLRLKEYPDFRYTITQNEN